MRLLCRYAGGLACLVTALALVACGGGPGSEPGPEPKQIGNMAFQQGQKARTISLSDKFTGPNLTYSVTTSNRSVATATVDNDADTLTVTAVGAGTATITVTAKNSGGEAKQTFTVTVPKPPSPAVEIPDIPSLDEDATRTVRLGDKFSGANLTYRASSSNVRVATVSVNNTADTLTVTAVGAGTATITVTATAQGRAAQTQTFTVTVPQPADEEVAPTVRTGATTSVDVAEGGTQSVTLSTVFDGAGLTYVVSSSADTVATASESGGTLTITGVSVGTATITVTATNTAGSSPAHAIAVTVSAPVTTTPPPTTTPTSTLTIELGESAKRTLAAGQTLEPPASDGVDVERSSDGEPGNVWIITAKEKGTHKVTILSAGKVVGEITVEVPNSRPLRTAAAHPNVLELALNKANLNASTTTPPLPDLDSFFTDEDANDNKFYRIEDKPSWFLIETKNGFLTDADDTNTDVFDFGYEVLKAVKRSVEEDYDFTVSLYASDGEDESTRPLVLKFAVPTAGLSPSEETYSLNQRGAMFNFHNVALDNPPANRLDIGPRRGVDHTLTFTLTDPANTGAVGFGFANTLRTKWFDDGKLETEAVPATTTAHYLGEDGNYNPPLPDEQGTGNVGGRVQGANYFVLKSTGAVVAKWADTPALDGTPGVVFKLKETGSSGTIRIEYYLWTLSRDRRTVDTVTEAWDDASLPTTKRIDSRTLTISVVTCSSPPDPIASCP